MAERQKPVTEPVLDNAYENLKKNDPKKFAELNPADVGSKRSHALQPAQFFSTIRNIKMRGVEEIKPLLTHTFFALKRLKVARDLSEVVPNIPKGSDHFDFGTFKCWVDGITADDAGAIAQLVALDATAKVRCS